MRKKIKILMFIADLIGFVIGFIISIWFLLMTFAFITVGGIIFYKSNVIISVIEFCIAIFSTFYFCYRVLRMITKKEIAKYLYK